MPAKSGRAAPKGIAPARSARRALSGDASFDDFPARSRDCGWGGWPNATSEADAGARPQHHRIVRAGHIAPGLPEVLEIRLQRPAGLNLSRIADFQKSLVVVKRGEP